MRQLHFLLFIVVTRRQLTHILRVRQFSHRHFGIRVVHPHEGDEDPALLQLQVGDVLLVDAHDHAFFGHVVVDHDPAPGDFEILDDRVFETVGLFPSRDAVDAGVGRVLVGGLFEDGDRVEVD